MINNITIPQRIDVNEFWSSIMGSLEFHSDWWLAVKYLDGADWNKSGVVQLTIENEDGKPLTRKLAVGDLQLAYDKAIRDEHRHCGSYVNINDMDECASDIVLQIAMLGDVVYA